MDQRQVASASAAAGGAGNAASEAAVGGQQQQQRENVASSMPPAPAHGGDGNAAAPAAQPHQARAEDLAASFAANVRVSAAASPDPPLPVASKWPPLSERLARKNAAVREAEGSVVAARGRVAPAIRAHGAAGGAIAKRLLESAQTSLTRAEEAAEQELARRERLRVAGLLDAKGDALPGGVSGAKALAELPNDMIREIFWRLPRVSVNNVALACSDWARLPLDLRACCDVANVGYNVSGAPGLLRVPTVSPDAATLRVRLVNHDSSGVAIARMMREALSAALRAAPRLVELQVWLNLDQVSMLAECLGARSSGGASSSSSSSSSLRRLRLSLTLPAAAAAAVTNAGMRATGAALAASAPGLECIEVLIGEPWWNAGDEFVLVETLLLSLLSSSGGGLGGGGGGPGGSSRLRELGSHLFILTTSFVARLRESFALEKMSFLQRGPIQLGVSVSGFPPAGSGVSRTLRELRFEVQMEETPEARHQGKVPSARGPVEVMCDADVSPRGGYLAPLARAVTRLVLDLRGEGAALPQVLRLPAIFRALRSVRSLAVRYPRLPGGEMETPAAAAAAARDAVTAAPTFALAGLGPDIVLATARRPWSSSSSSSSRRRAAAASPQQPWDLLSSLTELDVRFLLGNYELVLPRAGMPNLRRLDMRGMMPENFRSADAAAAAAAEPRQRYLPPSPAVVPNLRWLGIGFCNFPVPLDPVPKERRRRRALDLSDLAPASSSQPYRHLRTLVLDSAELVVEGGGRGEAEEVRRLLAAFPVVFPSLRMIHVHNCSATSPVNLVLRALPVAYAAAGAKAAASAGARGGPGGSSSSTVAHSFRGICTGCPGWRFGLKRDAGFDSIDCPEES